jgi:hypothetical protein
MSKLQRSHDLRNRFNALKARPTDSDIDYLEMASPHVERAFDKRMAPGIEGEYDWACAEAIIAFVERGNELVSHMVEEARLACI